MQRELIIEAIRSALTSAPYAHAAWLGGSDATGRTDPWSDVDVHVIVDDDAVETAFADIEAALRTLGHLACSWRLPEPTWHGHSQAFYRFEADHPFAVVDLVVMKRSAEDFFLQTERHGEPHVLFDRAGLVVPTTVDHAELAERRAQRLSELRAQHELFGNLVEKAVLRGHLAEAVHFYHAFTLRPLVEALRMVHCPDRFDFGVRYLDRDFPEDLRRAVERLALAGDGEALLANHREARGMFEEVVGGM